MIKSLIKALASFVTIVAGHFGNRRPDRAILFFSIFVVSVVLVAYSVFNLSGPVPESDFSQWYRRSYMLIAGSGLLILSLSAVVTFLDSRQSGSSPMKMPWSIGSRIGAVLMTGLGLIATAFLAFGVTTAMTLPSELALHASDDSGPMLSTGEHHWFYSYVNYGNDQAPQNAPRPSQGSGYLLGSIKYAGKPAAGVSLDISLNGRYRLHDITTDKQGRFVLRLAPGKWTVDELNSNNWSNQPEGDFLLVSGHEPEYQGLMYSRYMGQGDELTVDVTNTQPANAQIQLSIHKKIMLLKPPERNKPVRLSLANDSIRWHAYPGAAKYQVAISRVTRHKSSTSISGLAMKMVSGTNKIRLDQFTTVPRQGEAREYSAKVYAFDKAGHFLSESGEGFGGGHTFKIAEDRSIAGQRYLPSGLAETVTPEDAAAMLENTKKLSAVEVLIKAGMYSPAKILLDGIDGKASMPGRLSAIRGYWYASQGKCQQAKAYFDRARQQGGAMCILDQYQQGCQ